MMYWGPAIFIPILRAFGSRCKPIEDYVAIGAAGRPPKKKNAGETRPLGTAAPRLKKTREVSGLELKVQTELDQPVAIVLARDLAEGGGGKGLVPDVPRRMVEEV